MPQRRIADALDEVEFGRSILIEEAAALTSLAGHLSGGFGEAVRMILGLKGRLIVGGLGKSGHIARKIAATFASTGTPASFLHLNDALHGDLGVFQSGDLALLISNSGETPELLPVVEYLRESAIPILGISSEPASPLLAASRVPLVLPPHAETGPGAVAPTTSAIMALALGDALAMAVMRARGFARAEFGRLHPAGTIGHNLREVSRVMHRGDAMPLVPATAPMGETVLEISAKRLGIAGVVDEKGWLVGVITDGDLRRNLDRLHDGTAGQIMSAAPKVILPDMVISDALSLLRFHKITALFVVEDVDAPKPVGIVHIHDLGRAPATF